MNVYRLLLPERSVKGRYSSCHSCQGTETSSSANHGKAINETFPNLSILASKYTRRGLVSVEDFTLIHSRFCRFPIFHVFLFFYALFYMILYILLSIALRVKI